MHGLIRGVAAAAAAAAAVPSVTLGLRCTSALSPSWCGTVAARRPLPLRHTAVKMSAMAAAATPAQADVVVNKVVVMMAMEAEAQPLISRLGLEHDPSIFPAAAPCMCFTGKHNGHTLHVVTNGKCKRFGVDNVGTVAGGLSAWLAMEALKPDLVINAGTAGGFKRMGAAIGDAYVSSRTANHDRRIPLPGFQEWGVGVHDAVATERLRAELGFKHGVVTTSNSLDQTEEDAKHMLANEASVKDMEGAAVAWACEQHGTPFFCIKVVTDIVDGGRPTEQEFLENLGSAAKALQEALPKTLDFVLGKRLSEL